MAITNRDRIAQMLELLQSGLRPFVEREMKAEYKQAWLKQAGYSLRDFDPDDPHFDVHALLVLMWEQWNAVFSKTLGHAERSLVSELRNVRNDWAHQKQFSTDDTYRALDSGVRLLNAVSASEAQQVERMKQELLRLRFEEQMRSERRKAAVAPIESQPSSGLRPWRELATPHPDVASGRYQQAEFAADLWQVYLGEGAGEYRDPLEFFSRTFLTDGLYKLLVEALRRVNGLGGNPIVQLQTNFGGGKTHSMLALYHLFSGVEPAKLAGLERVMEEAQATPPAQVRRAVLVGNKISPGQPVVKPDGTQVRTLWGEMAWQLGGREGYEMVRAADETATNPGDVLRSLFNRYAPCLILIDEWVAYARQLHEDSSLPGGSFDTHFTFAQTLTEAAKAADRTLLVVSLPASDIEVGGDRGREALSRLRNAIGRVDSPWRPASAEEGFEIVRRRLFQTVTDPAILRQRDSVIAHFSRLYQQQPQEFPDHAREASYERRLRDAYPIHPELFDRLYSDWSSLERFQRTRGVLRLMAAVIHALWERNDGSLLILPASVPIDDPNVREELTRYLDDHWVPVIERDVDGPSSLPLSLDRENPNFGRYSACRRVARAIYMGSAPTLHTSNPGIDVRSIKLGCAQPGETVATFGDALRRLTDSAMHLYVDRSRYWYSTQPTVTRLAQDRAGQLDIVDVWEELKRRLRADREKGYFAAVHAAPASSGDVPDEDSARLVILGPEYLHVRRGTLTPAYLEATKILQSRGNAPRLYQNMLVFLAPDESRLVDLEQAIRSYLAWKSIHEEAARLNLDEFQRHQARTRYEEADRTVDARILETYFWLLIPFQPDPANAGSLALEERRLQGQEPLAVQASRRLVNDGFLYRELGALPLRMELDKFNLWGAGDHVTLRQLWEYYARYPYLSRLRDEQVLLGAVQDGIGRITWQEHFAYADSYDAGKQHYVGLTVGERGRLSVQGLLVKPDAAQRQLDRQAAEMGNGGAPDGAAPVDVRVGVTTPDGTSDAGATLPHRIPPVQPPARVVKYFSGS
ncbi:MAG TPA: Swt1 family HEPN domain-containing protein, partial [Caldilineaceae bacterium]|nr:Swt1 family HEPN domain-containing protein [Caldilineaceae bacterium]